MQALQQDRLVPGIIVTAGISCSFCMRGDLGPRSLPPCDLLSPSFTSWHFWKSCLFY